MPRALAYHITFGTYGTRLHGDSRKTVDREHNEFGTPVLGSDPDRLREEKENLKFAPIYLTREQCLFGQEVMPRICTLGQWQYHTCACAPDHVHVVLTSPFDPKTIRRLVKRWLGQELSSKWPLSSGRTWWVEDGSTKWIHEDSYLVNAIDYVTRQRIQ
jgi:REP element-mobilizing transposase RayT